MQVSTLNDLFVKELRDMYNGERQLVKALPKLAKKANSPDLQKAIEKHLGETKTQVDRLERAFELLAVSERGPVCKGIKGILEEGSDLLEETDEDDVLDAGLIASAQKVEHYEIASYGTLREYANVLGHSEIVVLLEKTLEEEKAADLKLSQLAEQGINAMAINGDSEEGEEEEETNSRSKGRRRR
jgi:ferritin-like metal-binding protein YciE